MAGGNLDFIDQVTEFVFDKQGSLLRDERANNWLFMSSFIPVLVIHAIYLLTVYILIPKYMENRKPFELRRFIQCYNIFQVFACSALAYGVATSGWTTTFTFGCQPMDYSLNPLALRMLGFFWWNMIIKFVELIETVLFALRKKNNQISLLHVYHHVTTSGIGWLSCIYGGGGMLSLTVLLNSLVHVLMYAYYFLASLGPQWQRKLATVKSKLTIIQLIQLIILFLHISQAFRPSCQVSKIYPIFYMPILAVNIILFLNFYRKNYYNKKNV